MHGTIHNPGSTFVKSRGTKVHTSDRSPHLIVCGRLLLKNEMVKCAGTKKLQRSVRIHEEEVDHRLNLACRSTWRRGAFNEILWLVKIMIPKIALWGNGGCPKLDIFNMNNPTDIDDLGVPL